MLIVFGYFIAELSAQGGYGWPLESALYAVTTQPPVSELPILQASFWGGYTAGRNTPADVTIVLSLGGCIAFLCLTLIHLLIRLRLRFIKYSTQEVQINSVSIPEESKPYQKTHISRTGDLVSYSFLSVNSDSLESNFVCVADVLPLASMLSRNKEWDRLIDTIRGLKLEKDQAATGYVGSNSQKLKLLVTDVPGFSFLALIIIALFSAFCIWLVTVTSQASPEYVFLYSSAFLSGMTLLIVGVCIAGMWRSIRAVF